MTADEWAGSHGAGWERRHLPRAPRERRARRHEDPRGILMCKHLQCINLGSTKITTRLRQCF